MKEEHGLSEEEALLKSTVREFAEQVLEPAAGFHDQTGEFPWGNVRGLADLGMLGLTIDQKYGGGGGTMRQLALVVEEIARGCGSTSVIYITHLSLCTQYINTFGTEDQKILWLPHLVNADKIGAMALTEPSAGSDAAALATTALRSNTQYRLTGTKSFTTNGSEAEIFIILATRDRKLRAAGIEAFVVERGPGFEVNPQQGKMGMRATSTTELTFNNCAVPSQNILGVEGSGFKSLMEILNTSRICIAAQCVGLAQAAYDAAIQYAKHREAFGQRLSDFQSIRWTIADMATNIHAARLLVYRAANLKDSGKPFITEASMAKLFSSRVAVETADAALQIHGGSGYFAPATVERLYRDSKVTEIYEGTSEIQRTIISRNLLGT